ncbi:MAG TPA: amidohydrolase family protein [Terriglobales bacterium]|nr:amidohydrolase family protein [Terriglobales bacterium]
MLITDCHIHIEPFHMVKPAALTVMRGKRSNFAELEEYSREPKKFLAYLDRCGVDRAVLINYPSQEVLGFSNDVNDWVLDYCKADPKRLLPCGGVHPRFSDHVARDVETLIRKGIRLLKVHPPHQLLYPNAYLTDCKPLADLYRVAEAEGIPVMIHTGTSVFPDARSKFGDPIYLDDVAIDFPKLKILMAHGGRPLWMDTAFFLLRRHKNVYLDISGIPPKSLLEYFPRLEEIAYKTLFGTDWAGPGVPDVKQNLGDFNALPLTEEVKRKILSENALQIWPE